MATGTYLSQSGVEIFQIIIMVFPSGFNLITDIKTSRTCCISVIFFNIMH